MKKNDGNIIGVYASNIKIKTIHEVKQEDIWISKLWDLMNDGMFKHPPCYYGKSKKEKTQIKTREYLRERAKNVININY